MTIAEKPERLRTGEVLTVKVLMPPLEEYIGEIEQLTGARPPWAADDRSRLRGELALECRDLFFVGQLGADLVAMMWYTVSGDVGTFGHVFTRPEYRNQGISSCLMKSCLEYMDREEGLLAVYLGVTNPIARKMYAEYGWVPYNDCPNTCIMRRSGHSGTSPTEFDRQYYEHCGKAAVRKARRGDLPKGEALYNWTGNTSVIKDYPQSIFRNTAVESQIIALCNMAQGQQGAFLCLENPRGRMVGAATLAFSSAHYQEHNCVVDFLVHPNYRNQGEELLRAILQEKGERENTWFYGAAADGEKLDVAGRAGFQEKAVLKNYLTVAGRGVDLLILAEG